MMRAPILLALAAASAPSAALSVDWTVTARGGTGASYTSGDGNGFGASANLGLGVSARTKTTTWNADTGVSVSVDEGGVDVTPPSFSGSFRHREPRTTYTAGVSFTPAPASEDSFRSLSPFDSEDSDPLGVVVSGDDVDAIRLPLSLRFGITHRATPRDSFSANAYFRLTEYDKTHPSLTTSRGWGLRLGWNHDLRNDLDVGVTASARESRSFGASDSASRTYSLSGNANWRVNERLSLNGSLGPSLVQSLKGANAGDWTLGLNGNIGATYRPRPDVTLNASLNQGFEQDEDGDLNERLTFSSSGSWQINERESVRLGGALSMTNPAFGDGDSVFSGSLSPSYSWTVTRNLSVGAGYTLSYNSDDDSEPFDHRVFVNLSYSMTLLP